MEVVQAPTTSPKSTLKEGPTSPAMPALKSSSVSSPPRSPPTTSVVSNERRVSLYDKNTISLSMQSSPKSLPNFNLSPPSKEILAIDMPIATSPNELPFPVKLHQLLSVADERVIRWQPENDGRSFTIVNCDEFEAKILPRLYRTMNIETFGQMLSLYSFHRVEGGTYTLPLLCSNKC